MDCEQGDVVDVVSKDGEEVAIIDDGTGVALVDRQFLKASFVGAQHSCRWNFLLTSVRAGRDWDRLATKSRHAHSSPRFAAPVSVRAQACS
eukprot:614673-Rhodomonas_salina.2